MRFRRWIVFTFLIHLAVVAVDKGAGMILWVVFAQHPPVNGALAMISTLPFLLTAVANLGLGTSTVYYLRRKEHGLREAAETTSLVALIWGGLIALLAILLSQTVGPWLRPEWNFDLRYVVPTCLCVPLLLTTSYWNCLQLATDRVRDYNLVHLLASVVFLPAFFACWWLLEREPAEGMALGRLLTALVTTAVTIWMLRAVVRWRPRLHGIFLFDAVTYGWKANLTSVLTYLNHRLDLFVVGALFVVPGLAGGALRDRQLAEAAFYGLAMTWAQLVWHFPEATRDLFFSRVAGQTTEESRASTPVLSRLCLLAALGGGLMIWLIYDPLMNLLDSRSWNAKWSETVGSCLLVLLPGTIAFTVAKILQNDLAARGHVDRCVRAGMLALCAMLLLDWLWVPEHGAVGAAWGSTVACLLACAYTLHAYRQSGGAPLWHCLVPRRGDADYLKDLAGAVADKLRRKSAPAS
jgi:O-antigen/teichoic acid export membrane protein